MKSEDIHPGGLTTHQEEPWPSATTAPPRVSDKRSTVFTPNMSQAVHRWFRYSAGFSAEWVADEIAKHAVNHGTTRVLDPFVGSGTTLIAAQESGVESIGVESHPFVSRVAHAKLQWGSSADELDRRASAILASASPADLTGAEPPLLTKCFSPDALGSLLGLRDAVLAEADESPTGQLLWLAFVACIRPSSHVGTAQWQYVLPKKTKARVLGPLDAFRAQATTMVADMAFLQEAVPKPAPAQLLIEDSRDSISAPPNWATLVITSPPYANNYDYADATRLEMTVLGEVAGWSDLNRVREPLVRACSQHMARFDLTSALSDPILDPIRGPLTVTVERLDAERANHGGKKAYHAMIAAYFLDLARVWTQLRTVCADGATVCFVVGDSAPYGIHVPVEAWLGDLAVAAGFQGWRFEKTRDRNVKWKNRKHRVPLHEGRLWVQG